MKSLSFKQAFRLLFILTSVAMIGTLIFEAVHKRPTQNDQPTLPVLGQIPAFSLTERSGRTFQLSDLKGKVWIADFIFTRCAGPCPLLSSKMKILQNQFQSEPDLFLVSFSVDPDYDTPAVLSSYANGFNADSHKWFFLTGNKSQIYALSQQSFHLGVSSVSKEEAGGLDATVLHSTKLVLLDRLGRIRGYYDTVNAEDLDQLVHDALRLLADKS